MESVKSMSCYDGNRKIITGDGLNVIKATRGTTHSERHANAHVFILGLNL